MHEHLLCSVLCFSLLFYVLCDIITFLRDGDVYSLQRVISTVTLSDLEEEFCMGLTPLQYAAKTNAATITTLLEAGCDPNLPHVATGTTPLMFAARSGEVEGVSVLLGALPSGGDVIDDVDEHGSTALGLCSLSCNIKVAKLLIDAGADIFKADTSGNSPLHVGAFYCSDTLGRKYADLLLNHNLTATKSAINSLSKFGRTPLMLAAKKGNIGYYEALLLAGADESIVSPFDKKTIEDFKLEHRSSNEL